MLIAIDSCGNEQFALVREDGKSYMSLSFSDVLAQCPPGTRLVGQGALHTAATSANPAQKNAAAYAALRAADVTYFTLGTRVLGREWKMQKEEGSVPNEHLAEAAELLRCAQKTDRRNALREWCPFREPRFDYIERKGQIGRVKALRENEKLMARITKVLRTGLNKADWHFFDKETGAVKAVIYECATTTRDKDEFIAKLGCYCHGRPCYYRSVIMRRWRWRTVKLVGVLRRARTALRKELSCNNS